MAAQHAIRAPHTFLSLIPVINIAHKPSVAEAVQPETAVEGLNVFEAASKTTRSSSAATDDSTGSPGSSIDGGVAGELKNAGFLRLVF